jgi:hypothetical protein
MEAIERCMGRLFSRAQLLAPELERVGVGFEQNAAGEWISVLDPVGGLEETVRAYPVASKTGSGSVRAVVYPAAQQKNVPCVGFDRLPETKANAGFPISLTFPSNTLLRSVKVSMIDESGRAVAVRVCSPEKPLNPKLQRTTIGVHPLQPLDAERSYLVIVNLIANDTEWRHDWRFATSK